MNSFIRVSKVMVLSTLVIIIQIGCSSEDLSDIVKEKEPVLRGKKLVEVVGCHDCHTPKVFSGEETSLDNERLLSGHPPESNPPNIDPQKISEENWLVTNNHFTAFASNWGISFAPNLTPDNETGIGTWTEDMFVANMTSGKHRPPMPVFTITGLEEEDLKIIFNYLKTITPIKNEVPKHISLSELKNK